MIGRLCYFMSFFIKDLTYDQLHGMQYLDKVLEETLRMYPQTARYKLSYHYLQQRVYVIVFFCLFVCYKNYEKTVAQIFIKFSK